MVYHDCCGVVWVGLVDEETWGRFKGCAEVLEEGNFDVFGSDFFVEVLLGVVLEVVG